MKFSGQFFISNVIKKKNHKLHFLNKINMIKTAIADDLTIITAILIDSIKQWSTLKEKNFLSKDSKVLKNALFELSWRVLTGQMKVESAINLLEDLCVSKGGCKLSPNSCFMM
jgi:hypothetical protein